MSVKVIFKICFLSALASCHLKDSKLDHRKVSISNLKAFFNYDHVDYYYFQFSETQILNLIKNKSNSQNDSLKAGLIIYDTPNSINDTSFIGKLKEIGFRHREIPKDQFNLLDSIFVEKPTTEYSACASETVFSDLIVFRNKGKIAGIIKFSYGCNLGFHFIGTNANVSTFGQDGEFRKLMKLRP